MAQMSGKVALVTGAGSGIGRATALTFAGRGARVAVADQNAEGGTETVSLINSAGGKSVFIEANVADADSVETMITRTIAAYDGLDYAHNNAGIEGSLERTAEYDEAGWTQVLAVNLKGVWLCMKYELKEMLARGGGAIVNTASGAGLIGVKRMPAYVASKHGVIGLTKTAALEYAKLAIRVNAVCPGVIATPMVERVSGNRPDVLEKMIAAEPMGRSGTPQEIADAVVWLCSDAASFVTGHAMTVDGGVVAQ